MSTEIHTVSGASFESYAKKKASDDICLTVHELSEFVKCSKKTHFLFVPMQDYKFSSNITEVVRVETHMSHRRVPSVLLLS